MKNTLLLIALFLASPASARIEAPNGLATAEVTTAKIANGAVTTPKLDVEALDGFTGLMRLTGTGNHGIGTASPVREVHVSRSDGNGPTMKFTNSDTGEAAADGFQVGLDNNEDANILQYENKNIEWFTNTTQRMTLNGSGLLGLGKVPSGSKFDLNVDNGDGRGITLVSADVDDIGLLIRMSADDSDVAIGVNNAADTIGTFRLTTGGEMNFSGVSSDGSGKALCVKSDGNIGTCSDAVGASGTCTCG